MYHSIARHKQIDKLSLLKLGILHILPLLIISISTLLTPILMLIQLGKQCWVGLECYLYLVFVFTSY